MLAGGREGVRDLTLGSQFATETHSAHADENAGSSDEEDIWADPCDVLEDPQDSVGDAHIDLCP